MDKTYLAMYLDSPMQSWGYQSRFNERTTLSYPTRSGIIGLLCASMGIPRTDTQKLEELNNLEITVLVLQQGTGVLKDFHTVGGGWDKKNHPMSVVPKANDKPGSNLGTTVLTHREYLLNYKFGVIIEGEKNQLEEIAVSLQNPVWGVWLGRKACIPSSILFQGIYDSEESVIDSLGQVAEIETDVLIRKIKSVENFEDGCDTIMDVPIDFSKRQFTQRRIDITTID